MTGDVTPFPKSVQLARGERRYKRKVASPKQWQAISEAKRGPCRVCSDRNPAPRDPFEKQLTELGFVLSNHTVLFDADAKLFVEIANRAYLEAAAPGPS